MHWSINLPQFHGDLVGVQGEKRVNQLSCDFIGWPVETEKNFHIFPVSSP